jgi:hypothetical protein
MEKIPLSFRMRLKFLCLLLIATISSKAQLTKGNWLTGGNASFTSAKYSGSSNSNQTINTITISPDIGYFLFDKFAAGLKISITSQNDFVKPTVGSSGTSYSTRATTYNFGPFARYYFLPLEKQLNIFAEAGDQFGISTSSNTSNQSFNTWFVSAGPAFYFNENVALEFSVGYSYNTSPSLYASQILIGLGFQIHLKNDKSASK